MFWWGPLTNMESSGELHACVDHAVGISTYVTGGD